MAFWMSLELLHLNWQLAWPWLNLGNAFASRPEWVQWYEYTGTFGGTLWVLLTNLLVFNGVKGWVTTAPPSQPRSLWLKAGFLLLIILLPLLMSYTISFNKQPEYKVNTVILQPNINPYLEKFNKATFDHQLRKFFRLTSKQADSTTDLILWPETSIPGDFREKGLNTSQRIQQIQAFLEDYPQARLLSGISTYTFYEHKATPTARKGRNGRYYDMFNAAVLMDTGARYQFYHKSKLVPGVEKMPYPAVFGFLQNMAIQMGGTSGSLGSQPEAKVFTINDSLAVGPVICYESVFGDYVGDYVQKGADLIAVITNDAWWGDTEGYRQHFQYSILRAIEARRSVARSANTGISGFITPKGEVQCKKDYWVKGTLSMALPVYKEQTFYTVHGDYLGYMGASVGILTLIIALFQGIIGFFGKRQEA